MSTFSVSETKLIPTASTIPQISTVEMANGRNTTLKNAMMETQTIMTDVAQAVKSKQDGPVTKSSTAQVLVPTSTAGIRFSTIQLLHLTKESNEMMEILSMEMDVAVLVR